MKLLFHSHHLLFPDSHRRQWLKYLLLAALSIEGQYPDRKKVRKRGHTDTCLNAPHQVRHGDRTLTYSFCWISSRDADMFRQEAAV